MHKTAIVFVMAIILGAGWLAAADKPVVGTWQLTSDSPDGAEMSWTMVVKEEGGKLAGDINGGMGQFKLVDPKLEGNRFTFKIAIDEQMYLVETKVSGTKLEGSWKGDAGQGVLKGIKKL